MSKSQKGKIYYTMQAISLLPILLLGLLILAFGTISFTKSMTQEVFDHLDTSAHLFISLIDSNYPGDYTLKEYQIDGQTVYSVYKGNHEISGLHSMVDHFKKDTNMDMTLFYKDTRILTTITNWDHERIIGTAAPDHLMEEVQDNNEVKYYDNALINEYRKVMESLNYEVVRYSRDQYPQFGQLNKVRLDIQQASAMLVFGFKQIRIDKATFRPNTKEEEIWEKKWLPTPWNEIEVGLGAMLGLPILLVKDNDINSGIFDKHLSETFIAIVSANDKIDDVIKGRQFNYWLSKFRGETIVNDVLKNEFVNYIAKEQHEKWCSERTSEGWSYGKIRNDELKQHPCLVDYDSLPEAEK